MKFGIAWKCFNEFLIPLQQAPIKKEDYINYFRNLMEGELAEAIKLYPDYINLRYLFIHTCNVMASGRGRQHAVCHGLCHELFISAPIRAS